MEESTDKAERDRALLQLIDKVDDSFGDAPHHVRVMVTLRVAASWCIANGVSRADFADAAARIYDATLEDIAAQGGEEAAAAK